jgi:hypothetical protein
MTIEWGEIGIPKGYGPYRLLYNPPSGTVIAELRSIGEEFLPNKVLIRHKDSPKYGPIGPDQPMVSSESLVTALSHPTLFYLSHELRKQESTYAGRWLGLYSFDIENGTSVKLAGPGLLSLPSPYVEGWVTGIVDVSADAAELYLTMGMMEPSSSGGFRAVDHYLARMDVPTRGIHLVTRLRGVFF